ncbi:MAG: hypothetical protein KDK26_16440 [Roseivivax sp.]|nr:hypothetical protein [Roseivivax sp.]
MAETRATPTLLGDETEHFWLAQRMARATGTDLVAAAEEGALTQAQWAEIVHRCRGCEWTCGCERWLDATDADQVRAAPETCVNHKRFAVLRRGQDQQTE